MTKPISVDSKTLGTEWLKSPITVRQERLQPDQNIVLQPYFGHKKTTKLYHTIYLIGTDPSCDFCFEDPFLSAKHAQISLRPGGEGYEVEDLGSKNGVFLNGLRVERALLPRQGILRVGRSMISWKDEKASVFDSGEDWICEDPVLCETTEHLKRVARSSLSILLLGETGTGKDVLANFIHRWSPQEKQPFIAINSANAGGSLVDSELFGHKKGAYTGSDSKRLGAIMSANHGTLFLDEIADLPADTQVKLLRTLESGEVRALGSDQVEKSDFRLISATSQDLESKIALGQFRLDLYYRIAGFVVKVPPLRDRPRDVLAIAKRLLEKRGMRLSHEAEGKLLSYSWPGNVREMKSTLDRSLVLASTLGLHEVQSEHIIFSAIKANFVPKAKEGKLPTLEGMEKETIYATLEKTGWSRSSTAKALGIARSTLFEKMKRYGIRDSLDH